MAATRARSSRISRRARWRRRGRPTGTTSSCGCRMSPRDAGAAGAAGSGCTTGTAVRGSKCSPTSRRRSGPRRRRTDATSTSTSTPAPRACRAATPWPDTGRCGGRIFAPARSSTSRPAPRRSRCGHQAAAPTPPRSPPTGAIWPSPAASPAAPSRTAVTPLVRVPPSGSATWRRGASAWRWTRSPWTTRRGSRRCVSCRATAGPLTAPASWSRRAGRSACWTWPRGM